MKATELIAEGGYDSWDEAKLNEIKKGEFSEAIGEALYENAEIKLWEIQLRPSERIPFRRHRNNYSCTSFSDGLLVSRNINGKVVLLRLSKGDHFYWECKSDEMVHDLENVGESTIKVTVLEEKVREHCEVGL